MACYAAALMVVVIIAVVIVLFFRDDKKEGFRGGGGRGRGGWGRGGRGGFWNPTYWGSWANYWPGYAPWSYPDTVLIAGSDGDFVRDRSFGSSSCLQRCNESYAACVGACDGNQTCISACHQLC